MALNVGSRLGHYDVTALIGEGGMGEVYRARDAKLDRDVALKVLPQAFTDDPDRLARFEREAKVLASLNHPNIGHIYGLEEAEGEKALVLELVEGPTLADRIAEGPIPVEEALPIAKQIAEALEAAHEQRVIHRDLKPANVKVKDDGTVKVLDFGLAKAFQPDASDVSASMSPTISLTAAATQMGMVIGTAAYMAPEQAKGKVVDKRADVWAFGAVFFEMLTGKKPFVGDDVSDTLALVLKFEPEWDALPTETPPRIRQLVQTCLQKDPKRRVHDVADVRLAMAGAFETADATSLVASGAPALAVWQRPLAIAAAVLAAIVLGGLGVWTLTPEAPRRLARFQIALPDGQTLNLAGFVRATVAISPGGAHLVYGANERLWLRHLEEIQAAEMAGTHEAEGPFFSADGQSVGFWVNGQLKKVALSGGAPVTLADVEDSPDGATWGADDMILYGYDGGVMQVSGASGIPAVLIALEEPEAAHGPQMLPDGNWVLYTLRTGGQGTWGEAQIVVQSTVTGERTVLFGGRDARYLPTGHLLYELDNVIFAVPFDVDTRSVTGGPVPLVEGVSTAGTTGGAAQFTTSTNGTLVYVPGAASTRQEYAMTWVSLEGEETRTEAPARSYGDLRVSPDGTRVASSIRTAGNDDIWIWHLDQGPLTRLTFDAANDRSPSWTPDGTRIVFSSGRDGGGLFWKSADGSGEVERLVDRPETRSHAWASENRLLFDQTPGDIGVFTIGADQDAEMLLDTDFVESMPALSPDGTWLAYQSAESGQPEVYVRPFPNIDDGRWQVSTNSGFDPVWSPDSQHIFYIEAPPAGTTVRMVAVRVETDSAFRASAPSPVFNIQNFAFTGGGRRFDIAPNGERFLVRTFPDGGPAGEGGFTGMIIVQNWFQELTARVPVP